METDAETLLWYAVRYTAGKPCTEVVQIARRMLPKMDPVHRDGLASMIRKELETQRLLGYQQDGYQQDHNMWVRLVEELDGE